MERADVTVVSGLPRSGTSLLMRMLEAGGLPPFVDGARPADAHNPHGYYEHTAIKSIRTDPAGLTEARGRAVKVVAPLVTSLPADLRFDVVFSVRDVAAVARSQEVMAQALTGRAGEPVATWIAPLEAAMQASLDWLARQPNVRLLTVDFEAVVDDPAGAAARIADFLGRSLDLRRMAAMVDPALPRHR